MIFVFTLVLFGFLICLAADQQQGEETFTITTYYPSPYGSYNQLEVYRSLKYHPVNKDELQNPQEGETIFNAPDETFYYYNGQKWLPQGGQAGYFLQCGNSCPEGTTRIGPAKYGTFLQGGGAANGYVNSVATGSAFAGGTCTCYCSDYIIGNSTVSRGLPCGDAYVCFTSSNYAEFGDASGCDKLCQQKVPGNKQVTNISICK